jgi:AcrR family transcriptional regulator
MTSRRRAPTSLAHPVKQARGQETLDRLLDAAEEILGAEGLDGATVPAIAARAGVSVGNVYKRFPDKDALMRAVYERFFERSLESNRSALDPARWQGTSLDDLLHAVVSGMVRGYRLRRAILRPLLLYAESHADRAFRRRAEELRHETLRLLGALLASRRSDIGHPDPERGIAFAILVVAHALQSMVLGERDHALGLAASDAELAEELAVMVTRYLKARSA